MVIRSTAQSPASLRGSPSASLTPPRGSGPLSAMVFADRPSGRLRAARAMAAKRRVDRRGYRRGGAWAKQSRRRGSCDVGSNGRRRRQGRAVERSGPASRPARPGARSRGQVGTIVEVLDDATSLVEFSDDRGKAHAIVPCPKDALLMLRTILRAV